MKFYGTLTGISQNLGTSLTSPGEIIEARLKVEAEEKKKADVAEGVEAPVKPETVKDPKEAENVFEETAEETNDDGQLLRRTGGERTRFPHQFRSNYEKFSKNYTSP